ncbi:MAG: hypothetical protein U0W24_21215 [Bacteroidales bacterium]
MILKTSALFISIILISVFCSCSKNKFDVDTSNIKADLEINRFDKDLLEGYPDTPAVEKLRHKYGKFLELYSQRIIEIGSPDDPRYNDFLNQFNKYCKNYEIPARVETTFGDFSKTAALLEKTFKYYKYYFPDKKIPIIYTLLSGFRISVITDEGMLGIGLDRYLGADCELYKAQGLEKYKTRRMDKVMIPVDCMRALAIMEFPMADSANNMVSHIIYEGKIQYFLDAMLPFEQDTIKFGYTADQLYWANHNEDKIWASLIERQMLFSTDQMVVRKMVEDAPFTALFANNSAPRAGAFIGWKIVHKYMDLHPEITLGQLMQNNDYQGILNSAEYKP